GPLAYRSSLPLAAWAERLRQQGIPAEVSLHAGSYLCNAALYLTHALSEQMGLQTQACFMHLPLDPTQVCEEPRAMPCLSAEMSAAAIRMVLRELVGGSVV
ncbi:MAG: pyroglutamyl-peptidase I, partial [Planctomycetota bacterium]|nr:pyroglutamyl-peptidase I [Planctomycetota bacterium]